MLSEGNSSKKKVKKKTKGTVLAHYMYNILTRGIWLMRNIGYIGVMLSYFATAISYLFSFDEEKSRREWFENNVFDSNYIMKKEYKEKLASLPWVKEFYIGVTCKPEKSWQIYITNVRDKTPSMMDLKSIFGVKISSFVDLTEESDKPLPSLRFLRGLRSGDKIVREGNRGTISILVADGNEHFATTCYHCCLKYLSDTDPYEEIHRQLLRDYHENSVGCQGTIRLYDTENHEPRLGKFYHGLYDNQHDIAFVKLEESESCIDALNFLSAKNFKGELATNSDVAKMFYENGGLLTVEKIGAITGITRGKLHAIESSLHGTERLEIPYRIKGTNGEVFAENGDSGSLLYILESENKRIPFAYLCFDFSVNPPVYGARNLHSSITELKERTNGKMYIVFIIIIAGFIIWLLDCYLNFDHRHHYTKLNNTREGL